MATRLPSVHINGKSYFIDERLHELRSTSDPHDAIRFESVREMDVFLAMNGHHDRMDAVVEQALDAFWHAVATAFPEARCGDFSPQGAMAIDHAARIAIGEWIANNVL